MAPLKGFTLLSPLRAFSAATFVVAALSIGIATAGAEPASPTVIGPAGAPAQTISIDPGHPADLLATEGPSWRSVDGGASWTSAPVPTNGQTAYRPGGNEVYVAGSDEVVGSDDGGATWDLQIPALDPRSMAGYPVALYTQDGGGLVDVDAVSVQSWDGTSSQWSPQITGLPPLDGNFHRVLSSAIAPDAVTAFLGLYDHGLYVTSDITARPIQWTAVPAPFAGDSVTAIAVSPDDSQTMIVQASSGSYRTTDGGSVWTRIPMAIPDGSGGLAFAPSDGHVAYLEDFQGVRHSDDAGATWSGPVRLPGGYRPTEIAVSPLDADVVYAATPSGIDESTDGGVTWTETNAGMSSTPYFVMSAPSTPDTLFTGNRSGLYRSRDAGASWSRVQEGLPDGIGVVKSMDVDPYNSQRLFIDTAQGFYTSSDEGESWALLAAYAAWDSHRDGRSRRLAAPVAPRRGRLPVREPRRRRDLDRSPNLLRGYR